MRKSIFGAVGVHSYIDDFRQLILPPDQDEVM